LTRCTSVDQKMMPVRHGFSQFQNYLTIASLTSAPACPSELVPIINRAASEYGLDPALIKAVISVESGFKPNAVSSAGARGLMQLLPSTAISLGVNPDDPEQNIQGGARYLRQQLDRFGSIELALAAYNAGPGSVLRYGGIPPFEETERYVSAVLTRLSEYAGTR
ncbi:MAG: lytic transglycosylase domain-containing protein, partial [Armatimonadetes bacterium]|nr:lytic transglycosylase domain-containing protein [Armatimonadota bacterium]